MAGYVFYPNGFNIVIYFNFNDQNFYNPNDTVT